MKYRRYVRLSYLLLSPKLPLRARSRQYDRRYSADWVIDLGPEGGDGGGRIVATGTPEQVAATAGSFTGEYLRPLLSGTPRKRHNVG